MPNRRPFPRTAPPARRAPGTPLRRAGAALAAACALAAFLPAPSTAAPAPAAGARAAHTRNAADTVNTSQHARRARDASGNTDAVERKLNSLRGQPSRLRSFLKDLPKGGDLHTHLSGAVPTEALIRLAARRGLCINTSSYVAAEKPCGEGTRPAQDAVDDPEFRRQVIAAWSMEEYRDTSGVRAPGESGHDHFFATFGKFGAVTHAHRGELLAEVAKQAAAHHQPYLEPLFFPTGDGLQELADSVSWDDDLEALRTRVRADPRMAKFIRTARANTDSDLAEYRRTLGCDGAKPAAACDTQMRFQVQVGRTASPKEVFIELLAGLELARQDSRFVGVNLAQAEDSPVALRDYRLQMRMIKALRAHYPNGHTSLHAGELTPRLVDSKDLRFHIRDAVHTAGAERIGHGVDLRWEDNPQQLLRTMARRHTAVEVPLTSNCQILEVCGADHPLRRYLAAGVPAVLATDDPGVSRIDITHEYQRAVTQHGLGYRQLRDSARASLEHAFLPGDSLWKAPDDHRRTAACAGSDPGGQPSAACRGLLERSPKARLQWQQEADFADFESRVRHRSTGTQDGAG